MIPGEYDSLNESLNALSRLVISITGVMFLCEKQFPGGRGSTLNSVCGRWREFFALGMGGIVGYYFLSKLETSKKESFRVKPVDSREDFTVPNTYIGTNLSETVVAPTFAEEWHIPEPAYDQIDADFVEPGYDSYEDDFTVPTDPRSMPYGQYLTRLNMLPSDEMYARINIPGGMMKVREFANSNYTRRDLQFREDISRIHKKSIERRNRQSGRARDIFSPYKSY